MSNRFNAIQGIGAKRVPKTIAKARTVSEILKIIIVHRISFQCTTSHLLSDPLRRQTSLCRV